MKNKRVLGMKEDMLLTTAGILCLALLLSMNLLVEPEDNLVTTKRDITFETFGMKRDVLVDDNPDFTSPLFLEKPYRAVFEPGTYYWKSGLSKMNKFTIQPAVAVETSNKGEDFKVRNVGNTEIKLDFMDRNFLTGSAVLGVGESLRKKSLARVTAKQSD